MKDVSVLLWHIGDVVRKAREARGWTQKQLATRAKVRANTLLDIEKNVSNLADKRVQDTLAKVAVALSTDRVVITVEGLQSLIPAIGLPPTQDPTDSETIARFLQLDEEQKRAVRAVIDVVRTKTDDNRQPAHASDQNDDAPQRAAPVPRRHP